MKTSIKFKEEIFLNNTKYLFSPGHIPFKAYYNVQYYKYFDALQKHKYVCHIVILDTVKISNYKYLFELEMYAIKKYFERKRNIHRYDSIFYLVVEFKKRIRFTPDISMHKYAIEQKINMQRKLKINLGQMVFISPGYLAKVISVIPIINQNLKEDQDYAFASDFNDALKKIDSLNYLFPDYIEGL